MLSHRQSQKGSKHYSEYQRWKAMKRRCDNKKNKDWHNYGGRGIKVCKEWIESFETFIADMGSCPIGYSLDRIDSNGDYSKENCRWTSNLEQARNKRCVPYITKNGVTKTANEWAKENGIKRSTYSMRLCKYGWSVEKAAGF